MRKTEKNREFILQFFQRISGKTKTAASLKPYSSDSKLIEQLLFWEQLFPKYHLFADEMTTEGDRIIVRGRTSGKYAGIVNRIPITPKTIQIPFAMGYRILHGKILAHWFLTDQIELLDQLDLLKNT